MLIQSPNDCRKASCTFSRHPALSVFPPGCLTMVGFHHVSPYEAGRCQSIPSSPPWCSSKYPWCPSSVLPAVVEATPQGLEVGKTRFTNKTWINSSPHLWNHQLIIFQSSIKKQYIQSSSMSSFVSFCCWFKSIQPIKNHPAHSGTLWHLALIQYLGNHEPFEKNHSHPNA